jgi:HEAT repeat protein
MLALLITSRDPNVGFVFRQGLRSSDKIGRMLCAFGLGAFGDPDTVVDLSAGLSDPEEEVQIATTLALGAIGTKAAIDYLIEALLTGSEVLRRAAAEMFATDPAGEGHEILREALDEERMPDVSMRRAAVYGVRRVGMDWAVELLVNTLRNDSHWLVRTAANDAVEALQSPSEMLLPKALPELDQVDWLVAWATGRGMDIPPGPEGVEMVIRALQEGEETVRIAAAQLLGVMGRAESIKPLYAMLQDDSPAVRDAAHRALGQTQVALGIPLPAV